MEDKNIYDNFTYDWWKNLDKIILFLILSLIIFGIFFRIRKSGVVIASCSTTPTILAHI